MLKADIDRDLKTAMLARDKRLVSILRSIKSAILYKEVADNTRDTGLGDDDIVLVLKKERKSRLDASGLYHKEGEKERAEEEDYQISIIEKYLPAEMSEDDVVKLVDSVITELGIESPEMKDMGRIIGVAKKKEQAADGSVISKIVKQIIQKG